MAGAARYDMLAVDLDGTLLSSERRVSRANAEALAEARRAGMTVTVCTGRGLVECEEVLRSIEQAEPVVVAGGSMLACPVTRGTLHRFPLEPEMVARATDRLLSHGHAVMVLKDPAAAGYDYLVVVGEKGHTVDPVTRWWFEQMPVKVRYAARIEEDEHPEHSVRLGVCGLSGMLAEIAGDLSESFGEQAVMHHFPAVVGAHLAGTLPAGQRVHILEVFAAQATKWSAIQWLAEGRGVDPARIAAIGDEINDLPMIRGAGLGVAMGNAVEPIRAAASRHTRSNDDDGVAWAVRRILDGEW